MTQVGEIRQIESGEWVFTVRCDAPDIAVNLANLMRLLIHAGRHNGKVISQPPSPKTNNGNFNLPPSDNGPIPKVD